MPCANALPDPAKQKQVVDEMQLTPYFQPFTSFESARHVCQVAAPS
jgi:hypothetical protein